MLLSAVVGAVVAAGFTSTSAHAAEFQVGVIMPMSGPGAEVGKENVQSAKAGVALVNARGGIGGMHVRMTVCDNQNMEQQAVLCARRLIGEGKANILMSNGTPQTLAIEPTVSQAGVPLFAIAGGTLTYRPVKKWAFKAIASNEDDFPVAIEYLKSKGLTRVAIIHDNGPFGTDIANTFKKYAPKGGVEVVADEQYSPSDVDVSAQLTHIRGLKPDAIVNFALTQPIGAAIVKRIVQLGITAPILVGPNIQSSAFVKLIGDAASQVIFVGQKAAMSELSKDDPLFHNISDFRKYFAEANPGVELNSLSANLADPLLVTQAAAHDLGERALDAEALLKGLNQVTNVAGVQGFWTFTPSSHESALRDGVALMKYVKGSWEAVQ